MAVATALLGIACGGVLVEPLPEPPSRCPRGPFGGDMVEVPAPDGSSYCVDSTEATNAQYAAFLATDPTTQDWPAICQMAYGASVVEYQSFTPTVWPRPDGYGNHPIDDVNWCAAATFCAANGKRLCGRIGGGGLGGQDLAHAAWEDGVDPDQGEWENACSAGGAKLYSYGAEFQAGRCSVAPQPHSSETPPVGNPTCEGGFDGLFDLGGGEREWIDDCMLDIAEAGPWPQCAYMGSNADAPEKPTCLSGGDNGSMFGHGSGIGFRCCADVLPSG